MTNFMLSTHDNPYDPSKDWELWERHDRSKGHNTMGILARVAKTSIELSDAEYNTEVEKAIDGLVRVNPTHFKKVKVAD